MKVQTRSADVACLNRDIAHGSCGYSQCIVSTTWRELSGHRVLSVKNRFTRWLARTRGQDGSQGFSSYGRGVPTLCGGSASLTRSARERWRLRFTDAVPELTAALRYGEPAIFVCELGNCSISDLRSIGEIQRASGRLAPLVLRFPLKNSRTRTFLDALRTLRNIRWSIHTFDDVSRDIDHALQSPESHAPHTAILNEIGDLVPPGARDIVTGAARIGERRAFVGELAQMCDVAPRTVEWRLAAAKCLSARDLLSWMLSLHSVWRLEVLQLSVKHAAAEAEFGSRAAFANFVKRHAHLPPARIHETPVFQNHLAHLASIMRNREEDKPAGGVSNLRILLLAAVIETVLLAPTA